MFLCLHAVIYLAGTYVLGAQTWCTAHTNCLLATLGIRLAYNNAWRNGAFAADDPDHHNVRMSNVAQSECVAHMQVHGAERSTCTSPSC